MKLNLEKITKNSRTAFDDTVNPVKKNRVLKTFSNLLKKNKRLIFKENRKDMILAKQKKIKESLIKRLELDDNKIKYIIKSVKDIIKIKDPTNKILEKWKGQMDCYKKSYVPIGVIAVIYESSQM